MEQKTFFQRAGRATDAIGTPDFLPAFIDLIGGFLPWDQYGVVQYTRTLVPHYLSRGNLRPADCRLYSGGFYRFDPFFRFWRTERRPGVYTLIGLTGGSQGDEYQGDEYMTGFQFLTGMADELGVLFPTLTGSANDFFFPRQAPYTADEVARLTAAFPFLQALHAADQRSQLRRLGERGAEEEAAWMILRRDGREAYASASWHRVIGDDAALSDAVARLRRAPAGAAVEIPGRGVLEVEALDSESPVEPGGRAFFLSRRPLASAPLDTRATLSRLFDPLLSPRERAIVHLAIAGYANADIAKRLGIGVGTVRNHRKRLYRKLDITSERELFLLVLRDIAAVA